MWPTRWGVTAPTGLPVPVVKNGYWVWSRQGRLGCRGRCNQSCLSLDFRAFAKGILFFARVQVNICAVVLGRGVGGVGPAPVPLVEIESHLQQLGAALLRLRLIINNLLRLSLICTCKPFAAANDLHLSA